MKNVLLLICLLSLQYPLHAQHEGHKTSAIKPQTIYTCPMHPEIQSDKPGNCPKCGMKLVAQKPKVAKPPTPVKKSSAPLTKPARQAAPATSVKKSQPARDHDMDNMKMPMNESHENMDGRYGGHESGKNEFGAC